MSQIGESGAGEGAFTRERSRNTVNFLIRDAIGALAAAARRGEKSIRVTMVVTSFI